MLGYKANIQQTIFGYNSFMDAFNILELPFSLGLRCNVMVFVVLLALSFACWWPSLMLYSHVIKVILVVRLQVIFCLFVWLDAFRVGWVSMFFVVLLPADGLRSCCTVIKVILFARLQAILWLWFYECLWYPRIAHIHKTLLHLLQTTL